MDIYEIRKGKTTVLSSTVPNCGYSAQTLKSLKANGFSLYKNGQKVR